MAYHFLADGWESQTQRPCELAKTTKNNVLGLHSKQTKNEAEQCLASKVVKIVVSYLTRRCGQKAGNDRLNSTPMFTFQPYSATQPSQENTMRKQHKRI